MSETAASLIESVKSHVPRWTHVAISGAFFGATLLANVTANKTHIADVQNQQEKRLTVLEDAVKNDLATRREVDDVKTTVIRIEDKLDKELEFHRHTR